MAVTQSDLVVQMLAQLRMLDPSISAEVGTPERKILDSVASALSDAQIDLTQLQGALDIDTKTGSNLDNFLALFGFGRQQAVKATGFVEFGRESGPSLQDIRVPAGTQVMAPGVLLTDDAVVDVIYETTFDVTLLAGQTSVQAPVRAIAPGSAGNVSAGTVTAIASNTIFGIETINNPAPITGGIDGEDDDQLKVRFKNTVFRNLAGTQDQYIALALSAAYTKKVNVVGPISRYREYLQVPLADDATAVNVNTGVGPSLEAGGGNVGEYTTALSTIPYSKYTYTEVPNFVSNGAVGTATVFWREGIDYRLNTVTADRDRGDAHRFYNVDVGPDLAPDPATVPYRPNITFTNVIDSSADATITSVREGDTVLFEHSYLSTASRNDKLRNITNCIDVFIDGSNDTVASTILPSPGSSVAAAFTNTTTSKYFVGSYRRAGRPDVKPTVGNLFFPLFWQPSIAVPSEIVVTGGGQTAIYYEGEHYWLVEDVTTELHGTIRARNGLEWNMNAVTGKGAINVGDLGRTGALISGFPQYTPIEVTNYVYDKNIVDLQAALEQAKQVTTDILVHRARERYFKLDITVMYSPGLNPTAINASIRQAMVTFFANQYFGNVIQLSDILQAIHAVAGVDNVRWSSDTQGNTETTQPRITETDRDGNPLTFDRYENPGPIILNSDFFIQDDEMPRLATLNTEADIDGQVARQWNAVPGILIRTRAQNTWTSS